jgi:hypothetical protein
MKKVAIIITIAGILVVLLLFSILGHDYDTKNLSSGYSYNSEHRHIIGEIDIPPNVISYDYDKNFIIVKQKPTEIQYAIYDKMKYVYRYGSDSIYYWIIMHKNNLVLGPMDSIEYIQAKSKYQVSEKLDINKWRQ